MDTCEQKYKDALKRAKECHIDGLSLHQPVKDVIEYIFPELKESEDEKVRKEILGLVQYTKGRKIGYEPRIHQDEILAWLEKQGEQKPAAKYKVGDTVYYDSFGRLVSFVITNIVEDGTGNPMYEDKDGNSIFQNELVEQKPANEVEPFDKYKGLTDFERTLADICIGWIGEEPGWKQYIKDNADVLLKIAIKKFNSVQDVPFKQKPAWSEEDENGFGDTLWAIKQARTIAKDENDMGNVWYAETWLKSIKNRIKGE